MAGWTAPRMTAAASGRPSTQTDQCRPPAPPRNAINATPPTTSARPASCTQPSRSPRKSTANSTANSGVTLPAAPATAGPSLSLERTARIETTTGKMQPTAAKIAAGPGVEAAASRRRAAPRSRPGPSSRRSYRAASARTARCAARTGSGSAPWRNRMSRPRAKGDGRAAHGLLEAPASEAETGKMDTLTYWNGTWHEGNPAILGPRDHAFWLGSIVFDGGRAFEGCGPDLDLHAERVVRSARSLGLNPTKTAEEILDADARGDPPLRAQGRALRAADVLGDQGRRRTDLGRRRFLPVPALRLPFADARRHAADARPLPHHPPADAGERADRCQGKLPLSQLLARRGRDDEARLPERHRARCAGQRGRDLQLQHLPGQERHRQHAGAQRHASWPASRATAPSSCCATPASRSRSAR